VSALAERLRQLRSQAGAKEDAATAHVTRGPINVAPSRSAPTAIAEQPEAQGPRANPAAGIKALLRRHLQSRSEQIGNSTPEPTPASSVANAGSDARPVCWASASAQRQPTTAPVGWAERSEAHQGACAGESAELAAGAWSAPPAGTELAPGLFEHIERIEAAPPPSWLWLPDLHERLLPADALLHFDTETTGLAGGTGTRAFMLGFARWTAAGMQIRQLWITRLGAETQMLERFSQWLAEGPFQLVSYNGRSFDAPLLAARYRLSRLRDPLKGLLHHDLLHAVRRRFGRDWPNCRLAEAEQRLLGVQRHDDLPGSAAPAAFLQALRGGGEGPLQRVRLHHRQDLISLAGLLPKLCELSARAPLDWRLRDCRAS
jgi:uncharacterized protein